VYKDGYFYAPFSLFEEKKKPSEKIARKYVPLLLSYKLSEIFKE
jgi:hypothetical protein